MDVIGRVLDTNYPWFFAALTALAFLGRVMDMTGNAVRRNRDLPNWMHEVAWWANTGGTVLTFGSLGAAVSVTYGLMYHWNGGSVVVALMMTVVVVGIAAFLLLVAALAGMYGQRLATAGIRRYRDRRSA